MGPFILRTVDGNLTKWPFFPAGHCVRGATKIATSADFDGSHHLAPCPSSRMQDAC
jgi:hypothetical protein